MLRGWRHTTFQALENPQYRLLWLGSLFSMLAFMMQWTVQAVVAFDLAGTNSAVGLVQLGVGLSMLILGPFGGVVADRVSKKPLVFWGEFAVAVSMAATGVLILLGVLTILWLVLLTAVMGLVFAFLGPALQAWVGQMVPPHLLPNAVALTQLSMNMSRVGAPLLAAIMLSSATIGAGGAYLFMGALFIVVLATISRLPATRAKPKAQRRSVTTELVEGLRYVRGDSALRALMLLFVAVVVLGFMWQVVLPAFLERHLDRAPTDIGLILTVNAIAALAVSLPLAGIVGTKWAWPAMLGAAAVLGAGFLLLAVAPSFELALLTMLVLGPGLSGFMLVNNSLIMALTDPAYFGRVMSLTMLAWGVQGALALPFGALADSVGEREMLAIVGIALLAITVMGTTVILGLARRGGLALRHERDRGPPRSGRLVSPEVALMAGQKRGVPAAGDEGASHHAHE